MTTAPATLTLEALATRVEELERANSALREEHTSEVAALKHEIARLQSERVRDPEEEDKRHAPSMPASERGGAGSSRSQRTPRTSRRRLLQLGGAAAAATVGAGALLTEGSGTALAAPQHIASVPYEGDATGSGNWGLKGVGTSGAQGVVGTSDSDVGVYGQSGSYWAVLGTSPSGGGGVFGTSPNGNGVRGTSTNGVAVSGTSTNSYGVEGDSTAAEGVFGQSRTASGVAGMSAFGVGGSFSGGRAALNLQPAGAPGAPTAGQRNAGDVYLDSNAVVWVCVVTGTPGSWVRLAGVANGSLGGATTFLASPIRIVDTRGGAPITNGSMPLAGGSTLVVQVTGTSVGGISVPAGASAVVGNLTALPFADGDLTIWRDGIPRPNVSNLNYTTGINVANFCMAALSPSGQVDIYAHVGMTHVIFDVTGYIP